MTQNEGVTQATFCRACNAQLDEPPSTPISERTPCVNCGSLDRFFTCTMDHEVKTRVAMRIRQKRDGFKKFAVEVIEGWQPTWGPGKVLLGWVTRSRRVDKITNTYAERVVAEGGYVLKDETEPLSDHQGYGQPKQK